MFHSGIIFLKLNVQKWQRRSFPSARRPGESTKNTCIHSTLKIYNTKASMIFIMCSCWCVCIYARLRDCLCVYAYVFVIECVFERLRLFMCVCMCATTCVCLCVCVCAFNQICTHVRLHISVRTNVGKGERVE